MKKGPIKVILYGNSLFIAGLQSSLEGVPGLELLRVDPQPDLLQERICASRPDVLILESDAIAQKLSRLLLKELPHLTLIALDPESDRLLVLSVQRESPLAAADLVRLIRHLVEDHNSFGGCTAFNAES